MSQKPNSIEAVGAVRPRPSTLAPEDLVPGTLTQWSDDQAGGKSWTFVGDGTTSGTQVMEAAIEQESRAATQDPESHADSAALQHMRGLRPFAQEAASTLLQTAQPDAPIARGELKEFSLKDLLGLIEPFLQSYKASLEPQSGTPSNSFGMGDHKKTIGSVNSVGLSFPLSD